MKIFLMGDSTMKQKNILVYPEIGWGQVLHLFTKEDCIIENHAENGRSTKNFLDEGRFAKILARMNKGDFVICQFGHNDEKITDPNRYTTPYGTYQANLKYFADETIARGAHIVFATSISRHHFENGKCQNTHGLYPQAMLDFCHENNYTCIDLNQITLNLYNFLGEEETKKFHLILEPNKYINFLDGKDDHSHLVFEGAILIAELFVKALFKTDDKLKECFIDIKDKSFIV